MSDAFRTMIVPADQVELARLVASTLVEGGAGMWIAELSDDGKAPATYYVSTGLIPVGMAAAMPLQVWSQDESGDWVETEALPGEPALVHAQCVEAGIIVSQDEIDYLFAVSDVTEQEPFTAFARLGLELISEQAE